MDGKGVRTYDKMLFLCVRAETRTQVSSPRKLHLTTKDYMLL